MELDKPPVIYKYGRVNPDKVWGDKQRVIEVIGRGSGQGFGIKGANLPTRWDDCIDAMRDTKTDSMVNRMLFACSNWGYKLEEVSFDNNNILTEVVINSGGKEPEVSKMALSNTFPMNERGVYEFGRLDDSYDNLLHKIGSAIVHLEIISEYLSYAWGDNIDYGYIMGGSGYGSRNLKIPKNIFDNKNILTGENYQESFLRKADNIAGRFGQNLRSLEFDKKGYISYVSIDGDDTCYLLDRSGLDNQYTGHNVDTEHQAAALHGIVASHINDLIDKEERRLEDY